MAPSSLPGWEIFVDEACTQKPVVGEVYYDYYLRNNAELEFTPTMSDLEVAHLETPVGNEETFFGVYMYGVRNGLPSGKLRIYFSGTISKSSEGMEFMTFNCDDYVYDYTEGTFEVPKTVFHLKQETKTVDVGWNALYSNSGDWIPAN